MNREAAETVKAQALAAIRNLHEIARSFKQEEIPEIWKPLGILIGQIDVEILMPIYRQYPELDDLKGEG